ncbi:MAG: hypothetical protein WB919_00710 [Candidatus Sulfotelmatobacter sp.]
MDAYAALKRRSSTSLPALLPRVSTLVQMTTETASPRAGNDAPFYVLAALAGVGTGWVDLIVDDLLFTALLVLAACMLLGLLRPRWPWRWVIAMVAFIPITEFALSVSGNAHPSRAQVYGAFLTALPGVAGAYGGAVVRSVLDHLRQGT